MERKETGERTTSRARLATCEKAREKEETLFFDEEESKINLNRSRQTHFPLVSSGFFANPLVLRHSPRQ